MSSASGRFCLAESQLVVVQIKFILSHEQILTHKQSMRAFLHNKHMKTDVQYKIDLQLISLIKRIKQKDVRKIICMICSTKSSDDKL